MQLFSLFGNIFLVSESTKRCRRAVYSCWFDGSSECGAQPCSWGVFANLPIHMHHFNLYSSVIKLYPGNLSCCIKIMSVVTSLVRSSIHGSGVQVSWDKPQCCLGTSGRAFGLKPNSTTQPECRWGVKTDLINTITFQSSCLLMDMNWQTYLTQWKIYILLLVVEEN